MSDVVASLASGFRGGGGRERQLPVAIVVVGKHGIISALLVHMTVRVRLLGVSLEVGGGC